MAVKLFLHNILLLEMYSFEGFSNRLKNDGMVNNNSNTIYAENFMAVADPGFIKGRFHSYTDA